MKKEEFDTLIFDLDGTLFNTEKGIVNSQNYALAKNGFKKRPYSEIRKLIGIPLHDTFEILVGKDKEIVERCVIDYRKRYNKHVFQETSIFPGVKSTLNYFRKKKKHLSIATTKPELFAKKILRHYGMTGLFDTLVASPIAKGKREFPKEKILDNALKKVKFRKAVYIGDRKYDIKAGKHHRLKTIGVTFGIGTRKELKTAGADWIIDDFRKLKEIIK